MRPRDGRPGQILESFGLEQPYKAQGSLPTAPEVFPEMPRLLALHESVREWLARIIAHGKYRLYRQSISLKLKRRFA